jgi:hypothetical protein
MFSLSFFLKNIKAQQTDSVVIMQKTPAKPADSTINKPFLVGSALVTNNGINFVPTFSLNKPAAMFKFSAGKNRISFEPEFNFSLEGKPWYFIFWFRYKLLQTDKFRLSTAAQLGLNFPEEQVLLNGKTYNTIVAQRYIAADIAPVYQISKNAAIGIYYLHSHGLDPGTTNCLDFLTLNTSISNIKIVKTIHLLIAPQLYYLHQDSQQGTYVASTFVFEMKYFPISLSFIINQPIHTNIIGGNNFVWNVSLVYLFDMLHSKK